MPGKPDTELRSHHRSVASVHSAARWKSFRSRQAEIIEQYVTPVRYGVSSSFTAETVASSNSAKPSAVSPDPELQATERDERDRLEVRIGCGRPDAHCLLGELQRLVEAAGVPRRVCWVRQGEVAVGVALGLAVDQPRGPLRPRRRDRRSALERQVEREA